MKKPGIVRNYVSELDGFLIDLDKKIPLSDSQQREIAKHKRIAELRDNEQPAGPAGKIWEDF